MKKYAIILLFSLYICGCQSDDSEPINTSIETSLIGKGNLYGSASQGVDEQNLIINNETDWDAIITLFGGADEASFYFTETDIDFTNFTVIVAIDEVKYSGGHELAIEVNSNSENIIITVTDIMPEGIATTNIIQPYHIVKIPKNTLPVVFE